MLGVNSSGQLGLGDTLIRGDGIGSMGNALPTVDLGDGLTALSLTAGRLHNCARLDNGAVKCWGSNTAGQLGLGDTLARGDGIGLMGDALLAVNLGSGRTALSLTAGRLHTCALLDNGTVKCWGVNSSGQLGLGDTLARGDGIGLMSDALLAVDLGDGRTALSLTAGDRHTCALLDNGAVKCWGVNASGQLGPGDTLARGDGIGLMGNALPPVDLGDGLTALSLTAGDRHTCALLDNGAVKCWGDNGFGQLGLGDTMDRGDAGGEMGNALPAVGLGSWRTALSLTAGYRHTCAQLDNGTVKCWGQNFYGELGLGDTLARGDELGEMGEALLAVDLGTP